MKTSAVLVVGAFALFVVTLIGAPYPREQWLQHSPTVIALPALAWAARIANGCRCTQEVREIMFDPES